MTLQAKLTIPDEPWQSRLIDPPTDVCITVFTWREDIRSAAVY